MIKFPAQELVIIMDNLRLIETIASRQGSVDINDEDKKTYNSSLNDALQACRLMGLEFSAVYIERLMGRIEKKLSYQRLSEEITISIERVFDELGNPLFFQVSRTKAAYFHDEPPFGKTTADKFSKAIEDIQEAGKCFALSRYTATIFHLMRVMEYTVQYLGKRLNINLVHEKNWHNILDEVDKAIKSLPIKTSRQKAVRNKYAQSSAHLRMVKDAWRNDVMHPKETYTEEEAERVFRNVKDFMVHLATKL